MAIKRFEDVIGWQKSQDYAVNVYGLFSSSKDFAFKDQICRAVVSISNNIAEGFDRSSNADFTRFLYIALPSCSEVKSMLYLAEKLKYIKTEERVNLLKQGDEISSIIRGLIKSMKVKEQVVRSKDHPASAPYSLSLIPYSFLTLPPCVTPTSLPTKKT